MADQDSTQDKTEEPTERRLEDAKKKGQVPRSKDLNTLLSLDGGCCGDAVFRSSIDY